MAKSLSGVGFEALKSDIHVALTPDQGKRIRYHAIAIAAPTESVPPRHPGCSQFWTVHPRAPFSFMSFQAPDRSVTRSAAT